eukprot:9252978-Lingulodinium_polyedra.AAC.1
MRASGTTAIPSTGGGLTDDGPGHHCAERPRGVGRQLALGKDPGAGVPVDTVGHVGHVLAPPRNRPPLGLGPSGLEDAQGAGAGIVKRTPSVWGSTGGGPSLEVSPQP